MDSRTQLARHRPRRRFALPVLSLLCAAGAGGAGYYAYELHKTKLGAEARAAELAEENGALSDALSLHRESKLELDTRLTECAEERADTGTRLATATAELTVCQSSVSNLEEQKKKARAILGEFEQLTARFQRMIDTGKLDVVFRRGQMVVKLPARVLFPSGRATLSDGGKEAIAEVAEVLADMPRRRFTVAGHTDNVPVRGEEFPSNWELSTARAVTVTKFLIKNGVRRRSLVAAGYSQFAPVATNRTRRGRQRNRRIEIILEPDLRKLPLRKLRARK